MTRLVELGCRLRDDGMIGREASLVKSDLGDFEPIDWSGSNSWVPVVQASCEKIGCRSCGVVGERPASVDSPWAGPKDSSTNPQDGSASWCRHPPPVIRPLGRPCCRHR